MGIYGLTILFLGVILISLVFIRFDITRPKILVLFLVSLGIFLGLFFSIHHHVQKTCVILADKSLDDVRRLILSWGIAAPLMSIVLMTLQAVIAPLPSFLVTAANGLVFGVLWGTVISWTGAMCGALATFMMSRFFYRTFSRKVLTYKEGLEYVERISGRYGFKVVLIARLLPFISFDFVSYAAGLSSMRTAPFITATGIGMMPATIVYTVFGSEVEKLGEYSGKLFTFSTIAVIGLLLVWIMQGMYRRRNHNRGTKQESG